MVQSSQLVSDQDPLAMQVASHTKMVADAERGQRNRGGIKIGLTG